MPAPQKPLARISQGQCELAGLSLEGWTRLLACWLPRGIKAQENVTCSDSPLLALCPVALGMEARHEGNHSKQAGL